MNGKLTNRIVWAEGHAPKVCQNCRKGEATIFIASKPSPNNNAAPMYLCGACYYSGMVALLEDMGYLVLGDSILSIQIPLPDPVGEVTDEQLRKQRDWRN